MKSFREYLAEAKVEKEINEQVFTNKDVENNILKAETAKLGIDLLNSMENNINNYVRWILFNNDKTEKDIKNYHRMFNEFADDFSKFAKMILADYKK